MSLVYITGISGSGKSAVCEELKRRGYDAHEGDDGLSGFYHNETGERLLRSTTSEERTPEWRKQWTWKMSRDELFKLKNLGTQIFVCGVAANDKEYIDVFDKCFVLHLGKQALLDRLANRTNNDFGKSEHELQGVLDWYNSLDQWYEDIDAIKIDAEQPLDVVVDGILEKV